MTAAVVGSGGYIAEHLLKRFEEEGSAERILKIGRTNQADEYLDLCEPERFHYDSLNEIDLILFTAAVSGPDRCASDFDYCWSVNVKGTIFFIEEALKRGCRVLFFSSDAVFGDIPGKVYTELSETNAAAPYGRMKKAVEDQFRNELLFKAVRLSYVVSGNDRFVSYCLNCIAKGETAEVFHPFYRNCITISDVSDIVMWFIKHWEEYQEPALNAAGRELVSRVRIADELNRHLGGRLKYTVSYPGDEFYQNRPGIIQMESLYIGKYHILEETSFTEKIKKELEVIGYEY